MGCAIFTHFGISWHTLLADDRYPVVQISAMVDRDERTHHGADSAPTSEERSERDNEHNRLISLSDGVFAFAMTLLIVTIEVPELSEVEARGRLMHDVLHLWPQILSYVIGFLVIGSLWRRTAESFRA